MLVLLGALLVSSLGLSQGLGANRCSWGPNYWCANIPQASECGAVSHCISAVWVKEQVPKDDDEVCAICKEMVGEARDTLQSNETQEELRQVLEGSCNLIPVKLIAKECRALMDEFEVQIVETLSSEMNPDTVCTVSGLCNSQRIDKMLEKQNFGGDCNLCRKGAKKVRKQLKHVTPEQVETKFLELCGYLGSYSDACMDTVVEESDNIYQVLTQQFDDEICDLSGLCSQAFEKVPATVVAPNMDIQCEFCEKVVKHWLDVYASNASLAEFKALLDGVCERLDKANAEHCKHIVDQYYIPFFHFISNEIDPETVCAMAGLCGPGGFLQVADDVPITVYSRKPMASPLVKLLPASSIMKTSDSKCDMCDMVVKEVFEALQDKADQNMVKNVLETVCYRLPLPAKYEKKCEDFVEAYTAPILDFITNGLDPEDVCAALSLCKDKLRLSKLPAVKQLPALKAEKPSCVLCEYVINTVDKMLEDQSNVKQIEAALEQVCGVLPKSLASQCQSFVDGYTEIIIDMLTKDVSPQQVCENLGLCPPGQDLALLPSTQPLQQSPRCVLCEYVINTVDDMLGDKATQKEIESTLESVCAYLPSSLSKQCNTFVSTYTELIIDMLVNDVSPDMVCTNLGLCKDAYLYLSNTIVKTLPVVKKAPLPKKDPYCTLCQVVVEDLEKSLGDAKTQEAIEEALDVLCTSLSLPVHKECEKMVAKYTEEIISLLLQEYTSQQVCQEVQLCVNNDINTNDISQIQFDVVEVEVYPLDAKDKVGCELCEFAMTIIDERMKDPGTVDMVEREVQFVCSYLPDSVADACEQFVDNYGQKIIDALVDDEMNPQQVCASLLPECAPTPPAPMGKCPWGPHYYCASPFHAKVCGTTKFCKATKQPGF